MQYLVYNKQKRDEHYFFDVENDDEIYHKVINTLDCSKYWVYYSLEYLLKTYQNICDALDYEYELIYIEDILENERSFMEILSLMDKNPQQKIRGNK